jgi:hypothetical protein
MPASDYSTGRVATFHRYVVLRPCFYELSYVASKLCFGVFLLPDKVNSWYYSDKSGRESFRATPYQKKNKPDINHHCNASSELEGHAPS